VAGRRRGSFKDSPKSDIATARRTIHKPANIGTTRVNHVTRQIVKQGISGNCPHGPDHQDGESLAVIPLTIAARRP
jgi:hypothetical protein